MSEETKPRTLAGDVAAELRKALDSFVSQTGHGLREDIRTDVAKHLTPLVRTFSSADREGMVLDLSDLPVGCQLTLTQGASLWYVTLSCRGARRTVYRNGTTPNEAYTAALKAWREDG